MSSVFETRLIGNIGKNAIVRNLEKGSVAINFPVAHNKNWLEKKGTIENEHHLAQLDHWEARRRSYWNCRLSKKRGFS